MTPHGRKLRDELIVTAITVSVIVLMQRPDIRQALVMRLALYTKSFCQAQADFWQTLATSSAQAYQRARL